MKLIVPQIDLSVGVLTVLLRGLDCAPALSTLLGMISPRNLEPSWSDPQKHFVKQHPKTKLLHFC
jgi:hypothetical protein